MGHGDKPKQAREVRGTDILEKWKARGQEEKTGNVADLLIGVGETAIMD